MKRTKRIKKQTRKQSAAQQSDKLNKEKSINPHHKNKDAKKRSQKNFQTIEGILYVSGGGNGRIIIPQDDRNIVVEKGYFECALNGDTITATIPSKHRGEEIPARIKEVVKRKKNTFVGTLVDKEDSSFYLKAQDSRIHTHFLVPVSKSKDAQKGTKVFVKMHEWTDASSLPVAEVLKVLGKPNEHETEMMAALLDKGMKAEFDKAVEKEAELLKSKEKDILKEELTHRLDYRDVTTFTIDPDDAKDFDDALSYKKNEDGSLEIGVHVADVSFYVTPGSKLDDEAIERGTSVYLVDRTVPMLPEVLSNDLCSLNPKEEKLAFSVLFTFTPKSDHEGAPFEITQSKVIKTVICSDKRFTYEEAQEVLDKKDGPFLKELESLNKIGKKLAKQNKEEGALTFSQEEVKFKLNDDKVPIEVYVKQVGETNEMIEQYMLLANKAVTEWIQKKVPEDERLFLYRIHDKPDKDRIMELVDLLHGLGYKMQFKGKSVSTHELNKMLEATAYTPESNMVQVATIRSMAKAIYSIQNIGHFGLGFENYTHFTSPIRRYPDIIVHRLLEKYRDGERVPKTKWKKYASLAQELSEKEKNAMEAERASVKFKQVEYLQTRKEKVFDGVITGVTDWGIFVEEKTSKAEGLIRIRELNDDYYVYDKKKMALTGSKTKKKYRLGDPIKVQIKRLDLTNKTIEYEPKR